MMTERLIANRYELGELVGQGASGAVFRARDVRTGATVAVKQLRHEVVTLDEGLLGRFTREAEALRRLSHAGVVRLLDSVEQGEHRYLVMEYVPGGSLDALLRRQGPLPVPRAAALGRDLAAALAHVHGLGIVHRDIKPANVLLAADGAPRLTDFGAAFVGGGARLTATGVLVGTFAYLSPEVCEGAVPDARADIWALGVLLFELLAGRRPFDAKQPGALLTAILTAAPPDLRQLRPDAPAPLAELVARMLEKDRARRVGSAAEVCAALEHMLGAGTDAAPAAGAQHADEGLLLARLLDVPGAPDARPAEPPPRPAPAGRPAWLLPALALLVIAAIVALWLALGAPRG